MNISFIIPVLNGEKYILRCVESIQSEMKPYDEIIVVDNGSTDNTVRIVESFGNMKLSIYPKVTISALRNRGKDFSNNPLLAFIDSDCVLCAGWRHQVLDVFKDLTIHAAGSRYDIPDDACWIEKAWFSQKSLKKTRARYINSGNLVVRRIAFEAVNGFDESLITDEDCDFGERFNDAGFFMLEDPGIRVIHLGNPKTLMAFYKKEKWHSSSVFSSRLSAIFNRTTMISILFGITLLISIMCIVGSIWVNVKLLWGVLFVPLIPLIAAIYRSHQFRNYKYILELTLLWGVSFWVRIASITNQMFPTVEA